MPDATDLKSRRNPPSKIILDTDIGSDVDDALALVYVLNSPEIELCGVTTVVRNTYRRAQYASRLLALMGRGSEIPCCAGCSLPVSPWPGHHATRGFPGVAGLQGYAEWIRGQSIAADGDDGDLPERHDTFVADQHGVDFIARATGEPDGPRHLVCIGALTNVAMALIKDPELADRLDGITLMGGDFTNPRNETNIALDIAAARHVFDSGIALRVLPYEIGSACKMNEAEYAECQACHSPHMEIVNASMRQWVRFVHARPGAPVPDYLPRPYDSLTAMTLTHPNLFEWKRGTIHLEHPDDPAKTHTVFEERENGAHDLVVGVDRVKAMTIHQERLLAV
ncbi:nucleoside hydrolase [bacterium]|nr:nucleoside hydrolase [bacterium]